MYHILTPLSSRLNILLNASNDKINVRTFIWSIIVKKYIYITSLVENYIEPIFYRVYFDLILSILSSVS